MGKNLDYISSWDFLLKHNKSVPFPKQIVMGNEKLILTVMWNGKDHRASEMNHHQPHQRPVSNQRKWCVCGVCVCVVFKMIMMACFLRFLLLSSLPNQAYLSAFSFLLYLPLSCLILMLHHQFLFSVDELIWITFL